MQRILLLLIAISFCSCDDIIEVTDISNDQVTLLAPLNNTVVADSLVNFNWNSVNEAESYLVQIATPNFENASQIVLDSVIVIDTSFTGTSVSRMLLDNTYEWRVKAFNSDFETDFSLSRFRVETPSN